jgi:hypothetical protein
VSLAPQTASHFVPYVFSLEEIQRLIRAAEQYEAFKVWPGV